MVPIPQSRASLAPAQTLLASVLAVTVLLGLLMWIATRAPWLGLELRAAHGSAGVQVTGVDPRGPSAGRIEVGATLIAVVSSGGTETAVDALSVARSGHLFDSFDTVRRFLASHRAIFDAVSSGGVQLRLAGGERVAIQAAPRRPIHALPGDFWLASALAAAALLAAFGVLAFRYTEPVVWLFCLGTLGFVGTQGTAAVIFGRELAFDPDWGVIAIGVNLAARLLSYWALVMMLWTHPRRFRSLRWGVPIASVFAIGWAGEMWQWWPRPNLATPALAAATSLVAAPLLGAWQWRATRHHALDHAVAKVMVLSFALPTLLLTLTYQLPRLFGQAPLIESILALSAINLLMFVGFALGIARFRLFMLDRWWFGAWTWVLGGALVVGLDLLLLWFNTQAGLALGVSLALSGWAYFPLRQWLWRRFDRGTGMTLESHLPRLVDQLFQCRSQGELASQWRALVADVFQPLASTLRPQALAAPQLETHGQVLAIPGLEAGEAIVLEHAARGRRLFGTSDVALAAELLALSRRAADARRALDQRQAERETMLQDLHDGLGGLASNIALLAGMAQRSGDPAQVGQALGTIQSLAGESLSEIRGFMSSLDGQDADWPALAADLRADAGRRLEAHGLLLDLTLDLDPAAPAPDPLLRLNLPRLCQEAINNIVKHAQARRVRVTLAVTPRQVALSIADDGCGLPEGMPAGGAARPGPPARGLKIMQRRALQMGGTLNVERGAGTTVRVQVPLPLQSPSPGMSAAAGDR